jgi:hypothetical protein
VGLLGEGGDGSVQIVELTTGLAEQLERELGNPFDFRAEMKPGTRAERNVEVWKRPEDSM